MVYKLLLMDVTSSDDIEKASFITLIKPERVNFIDHLCDFD